MDASSFQVEYKQLAFYQVRWSNAEHQSQSDYPQRRERVAFCANEEDAKRYKEALEAAHRLLERDEHFHVYTHPVHLGAIKK